MTASQYVPAELLVGLYITMCLNCLSVHVLPDKPMSRKPSEVIAENCKFTSLSLILDKCQSCYSRALLSQKGEKQLETMNEHLCHSQIMPVRLSFPADFIGAFHKARQEPTKKYTMPLTESQEIGWVSTPLVRKTCFDS